MKKLLFTALVLTIALAAMASAEQVLPIDQSRYLDKPSFLGYVPDRFIVVLKDNVAVDHQKDSRSPIALSSLDGFSDIANRFDVARIRPQFPGCDRGIMGAAEGAHQLARHYKVYLNNENLDDAMAAYAAHPQVERVEPIGVSTVYATPNDTYYDNPPPEWPYDQWHYWDTYGIEADQAWDLETGAQTVIVGDLDIGTMYDHGDLGGSDPPGPNDNVTNGNIWVNTGEIPGNSVDDDGNGYVDDIIGWDFVESTNWYVYSCVDIDCGGADNDPSDGDGHGTHTAGTIAAISNNGYCVAGVAGGFGNGTYAGGGNGVKVVPCRIGYLLRYLNQDVGVVIMDYVAEAMYYMAELKIAGWNVASINCSFGTTNSGGLGAACDYLQAQDVVVCVAAGNSSSSSADYLGSRGDCIDIAATDENGNNASFTNYGSWVDVAAPGVAIVSTMTNPADPGADYISAMDGTSMACPHVAGLVALLESYNPSLSAAEKIAIITDPANCKPYGGSRDLGAGIVDARACLEAAGGGDLPPVAAFVGSPTSGDYPLNVSFTDQSSNSPTSWSWDFGDGVGTSTQQNPSYTYTSAGTYTVTLTATNAYGSDDEVKTNYITVTSPPPPVAAFVGSPTSGQYPLLVNFTDQSTNNPTSWSWDFGDGVGTSTQQNPSYTYTAEGTYTVTLTATNAYGSDDEIKVDYITVTAPAPPVADFVGSPTSGEYPLTVNFTDLSSGSPTSWSWDFGDGVGTSTEQNPSYTYDAIGTYTVTLIATSVYGSDTETKPAYINVTDQAQSAKAYAQSDLSVLGTYTGSYANTAASDDSYEVITEAISTSHPVKTTSNAEHIWTFDLGSGGSGMMFYLEGYRPDNSDGDDFVFEYSTDDVTYLSLFTVNSSVEQTYSLAMPAGLSGTVYVRVRDDNRAWNLTSLDAVYIDQMYFEYSTAPSPPVADFVGSPTSGPYPLTVNFVDMSTGTPTSWSWDFGDGVGTSTAQNPSYTYNSIGTYTVTLTATNAYGSDDEIKLNYINVTDQAQGYMHVSNMVVGRAKVGPNYVGTCTVTIYDDVNAAVSGAVVYVTATGPSGGTFNGTTAANGTVSFQTSGVKKPSGEWCFEVTNVTHATLTYDAASNDVTEACESGWVYGDKGEMIAADAPIPGSFALSQNYPNPFNPATDISFTLPAASHVTLEVFNITGQRVAVLADGVFGVGEHTFTWDGSNAASGIYLYRIKTDSEMITKKMVLMK